MDTVDYGPLTALIGTWTGDKGMDIAPESSGTEENPYYETLTFDAAGELSNAEEQKLSVLRYHQVVRRKSNDEVFHDQSGYWMWDQQAQTVMHSFVIPRGVALVAGGEADINSQGELEINVNAKDGSEWGIAQSPFMAEKARTIEFSHSITLIDNTLNYLEKTLLDIYGGLFDHQDSNTLTRSQ